MCARKHTRTHAHMRARTDTNKIFRRNICVCRRLLSTNAKGKTCMLLLTIVLCRLSTPGCVTLAQLRVKIMASAAPPPPPPPSNAATAAAAATAKVLIKNKKRKKKAVCILSEMRIPVNSHWTELPCCAVCL